MTEIPIEGLKNGMLEASPGQDRKIRAAIQKTNERRQEAEASVDMRRRQMHFIDTYVANRMANGVHYPKKDLQDAHKAWKTYIAVEMPTKVVQPIARAEEGEEIPEGGYQVADGEVGTFHPEGVADKGERTYSEHLTGELLTEEQLLQRLKSESRIVRHHAANALAVAPSREVYDALQEALKGEWDPITKRAIRAAKDHVAITLAEAGDRGETLEEETFKDAYSGRMFTEKELLERLKSKKAVIRECAAMALACSTSRDTHGALFIVAKEDPEKSVREAAQESVDIMNANMEDPPVWEENADRHNGYNMWASPQPLPESLKKKLTDIPGVGTVVDPVEQTRKLAQPEPEQEAHLPQWAVPCEVCKAEPGKPCRSHGGGTNGYKAIENGVHACRQRLYDYTKKVIEAGIAATLSNVWTEAGDDKVCQAEDSEIYECALDLLEDT